MLHQFMTALALRTEEIKCCLDNIKIWRKYFFIFIHPYARGLFYTTIMMKKEVLNIGGSQLKLKKIRKDNNSKQNEKFPYLIPVEGMLQ